MKEGWKEIKEVCDGGGINLENLDHSALYEGWVGPLWGRMGMLLCQEALGETRRGREQACSYQHSCKKRRTHCDYSKPRLPRVDGFRSRPYIYSWMG